MGLITQLCDCLSINGNGVLFRESASDTLKLLRSRPIELSESAGKSRGGEGKRDDALSFSPGLKLKLKFRIDHEQAIHLANYSLDVVFVGITKVANHNGIQ